MSLLIRQRMLKPRGSEMQRLQCSKMRPTKFAQALFHSHTRCVAMAPQGLAHPKGGSAEMATGESLSACHALCRLHNLHW